MASDRGEPSRESPGDDSAPDFLGEVVAPVSDESFCGQLTPDQVQRLYEEYSRELNLFLSGVLRGSDHVHDLVQVAFRKLIEVGQTVQKSAVKGWLFRVAFHEAIALKRREASLGRAMKGYQVESVGKGRVVESPLDASIRRDDVENIKRLLSGLPPEQQHVVRERIYEEKTFAVIADELGVPLGTVLTRMRLAMEKLKKWVTTVDR